MSTVASSSSASIEEGACAFCPKFVKEPYKCPRCSVNYCSLKCYRNEKHSKCSEDFYRERVKEHLEGRRFEGDPGNAEFFEERMKKMQGNELPGSCNFTKMTSLDFDAPGPKTKEEAEGGEPLNSDDEEGEEEDYLQKVVKQTVDSYCDDEAEVERQLLAMGVGADVDQLMSSLSEEEKLAFRELADQIEYDQSGFDKSAFRGKPKYEEDDDD